MSIKEIQGGEKPLWNEVICKTSLRTDLDRCRKYRGVDWGGNGGEMERFLRALGRDTDNIKNKEARE